MTNNQSKTQATCLAALLVTLAFAATEANALPTINLTAKSYNGVAVTKDIYGQVVGTIDNSYGKVTFQRDSTQSAGTGVFNPFLRLDVKGNGFNSEGNEGSEQGYNTSATIADTQNNTTTRKILDNMSPVNWTHDVLISSMQLTADNMSYQFKLDINEPGSAKASLLSLDGLMLFSTSKASQNGEALDANGNIKNDSTGIEGTKLWDMDADDDSSVLLDAKLHGPGSGVADMMMLVDRSIIDDQVKAKPLEKYLVLWSRFGLDQGANANTASSTADAGFEEWAYLRKKDVGCTNCPGTGTGVPAPGTAYLALLALGILGFQQRRQAHKTSAFDLAA